MSSTVAQPNSAKITASAILVEPGRAMARAKIALRPGGWMWFAASAAAGSLVRIWPPSDCNR